MWLNMTNNSTEYTTHRTTVYSIEDVPHLLLRKYFDALEDKRKLEAAWMAQGITGAVSRIEKVEIRPPHGSMRTTFEVRSNLVNGNVP